MAIDYIAFFIVYACLYEQAHKLEYKIKATLASGYIVALIALVISAGFEPTTHSLEGCCSIQLSYETIPNKAPEERRKQRFEAFAVQKYIKYIELQNILSLSSKK